jgi:hypothetical protein
LRRPGKALRSGADAHLWAFLSGPPWLVLRFQHSHPMAAGNLRMLESKATGKILILVELWI